MPARKRTSDLTILVSAGIATVLLTVAAYLVAPVDSASDVAGSSYSSRPDGAKAAYLLLRQLEYDVDRSFEPVAALQADPEATVLVLSEPREMPSQQDIRATREFLEAGGAVLATGETAAVFLPGWTPPKTDRASRRPSRSLEPVALSPIAEGADRIEMSPSSDPLEPHSSFVPVYGDGARPAVATARIGNGRAIWWSDSAPLSNQHLGRPGHVELLINCLGPAVDRTILWDEHYHGHSRSLWSYLSGTPLTFALAQAGVIAAAALFSLARRRVPIRPRVVEPRTSPLEFVETLGSLYQRAGTASAAVAAARARARRMLLAATGLAGSASDDELARAAAKRFGLDAERLVDLLERSHAATIDWTLPAQQAVPLVASLQALVGDRQAVKPARTRR